MQNRGSLKELLVSVGVGCDVADIFCLLAWRKDPALRFSCEPLPTFNIFKVGSKLVISAVTLA